MTQKQNKKTAVFGIYQSATQAERAVDALVADHKQAHHKVSVFLQ
jgi:hypothetical protein